MEGGAAADGHRRDGLHGDGEVGRVGAANRHLGRAAEIQHLVAGVMDREGVRRRAGGDVEPSEVGVVRGRGRGIAVGDGDALALDVDLRPGRVQEQHPDCAAVQAAVIVPPSADGQIHRAVAVQVPGCRDAAAEAIEVDQRPIEPALGVADLLVALDGAVGVHEKHPDRPAIRAAVVVIACTRDQVRDPIAVQVAWGRQ